MTVQGTVGEHVNTDAPVCTILNTETVLIEAQLPESDLGRLGSSHGATYETTAQPGTFVPILGTGGGRLVFLGTTVDAKTRTLPVVYEVPNACRALADRHGAHRLCRNRARDRGACGAGLGARGGRREVVAFVQVSGETFQKRDLTLGIQDGDFIQVLSGLAPGERVVTKGAYAIRLASVSTTIPAHGHAH